MAKAKKHQRNISNRRARFDYEIKDTITAGVQLTGAETRAIRNGQADLKGAYVTIKNGELWLTNMTVSGNNFAPIEERDKTRSRKLLVKSREIKDFIAAKDKGMTIVPLEILTNTKYIKVVIAQAVGKKQYDKRATIRAREDSRKINRYIKNR